MSSRTTTVLAEVHAERRGQDAKWGEQNLDPFAYLAILTEETGEASQAAVKARFEALGPTDSRMLLKHYRAELVQVAAVAVAMIECLDRDTWEWGNHGGL